MRLALWTLATAAAATGLRLPLPGRRMQIDDEDSVLGVAARCPGCVFDAWQCQNPECGVQPPGTIVFGWLFNFDYWTTNCFEEFQKNETVIILDRDLWCYLPEMEEHVSCDNMVNYTFDGVEFWASCRGPSASNVIAESCQWNCKNRRPAIRCEYQFDPYRMHGFANGHLDYCFVEGVCDPTGIEQRAVVCNGTDLAYRLNSAETLASLASMDSELSDALVLLAKATMDRETVQAELERMRAHGESLEGRYDALSSAFMEEQLARRTLHGHFQQSQAHNDVLATERNSFRGAFIGVGALVVALSIGTVVLYKRRKKQQVVMVAASGSGAVQVPNPNVVMGRTVNEADAKRPAATGVVARQQ